MIRTHHPAPCFTVIPLVVMFVAVIPATVCPVSGGVRRLLFAIVLAAAIAVVIAFIFIVWAQFEQVHQRIREQQLCTARLTTMVEMLRASQSVDDELRALTSEHLQEG